MGFTVYYRSTEPVDDQKRAAIEAGSMQLCRGRTWLSCEPVFFFDGDADGHMLGGCKPNFMRHPDDVAAARSECLPDGTIQDALDILCQLSRDHEIDWEISHDHSDGPIGYVRDGQADSEVREQIEAFGSVADELGEFDIGESWQEPADDEDDGPSTWPFGRSDD